MIQKKEKGFMALTSVLIIGAVVLILGISVFYSALTDYSTSTAYRSGQQAVFLADYCLQEGVLRLAEDINYVGGEEIRIEDGACLIGPVEVYTKEEDIDANIKKVSSLGRAGDDLYFSRSASLVYYIIESGGGDWEKGTLETAETLEIIGNSLKLKPKIVKEERPTGAEDWLNTEKFHDLGGSLTTTESGYLALITKEPEIEPVIILNSREDKSCNELCEEVGLSCASIGTDAGGTDGTFYYWYLDVWGGVSECRTDQGNCDNPMYDHSLTCFGYEACWTRCRCVDGIDTHALSVTKQGTGSGTVTSSPSGINCGSTCDASFASGTSVTLTAIPAAGSTFAGWSGACSGTGMCTVNMTANRSVTANFQLELIIILNSKTGKNCKTLCEEVGLSCASIGTDAGGTDGTFYYWYLDAWSGVSECRTDQGNCDNPMYDHSLTCFGYEACWTRCRCYPPPYIPNGLIET